MIETHDLSKKFTDFWAVDGVSLEIARGRTLVLVGEEDILTPPVCFARAMVEEIPRSKLVIIPEVGHSLLSEAPDAVTEALEGFLGSA